MHRSMQLVWFPPDHFFTSGLAARRHQLAPWLSGHLRKSTPTEHAHWQIKLYNSMHAYVMGANSVKEYSLNRKTSALRCRKDRWGRLSSGRRRGTETLQSLSLSCAYTQFSARMSNVQHVILGKLEWGCQTLGCRFFLKLISAYSSGPWDSWVNMVHESIHKIL